MINLTLVVANEEKVLERNVIRAIALHIPKSAEGFFTVQRMSRQVFCEVGTIEVRETSC